MVVHFRRHAEPRVHRLLPDRVARRRKCRCVERADCDPADRRVAVSFPIQRRAAIRAEMKSNAVATIGFALVDFPLTIEPHLLFRKSGTGMESGTGAALARLAVAQINSIGFTRGNYSKRPTVALPGSFHRHPPLGCVHVASGSRRLSSRLTGRAIQYCAAA